MNIESIALQRNTTVHTFRRTKPRHIPDLPTHPVLLVLSLQRSGVGSSPWTVLICFCERGAFCKTNAEQLVIVKIASVYEMGCYGGQEVRNMYMHIQGSNLSWWIAGCRCCIHFQWVCRAQRARVCLRPTFLWTFGDSASSKTKSALAAWLCFQKGRSTSALDLEAMLNEQTEFGSVWTGVHPVRCVSEHLWYQAAGQHQNGDWASGKM